MRTLRTTTLLLALGCLLAGPGAAAAQSAQKGSRSAGSAPLGSRAAGSRAAGSKQAGSKQAGSQFGVRKGVGSRVKGTALGTVAASRAAGSTTSGSAPAGSGAALGSRAAGSRAAASGSRPASRGKALTLGSQAASTAAGSRAAGSRAALGSRAAGSRAATGSRLVRSGASRARPASRALPALVQPIAGPLPRLSSREPGLLVVWADRSRSMAGGFAGQSQISKADALADVVNGVVGDFVDRMNVNGQIRPRLDVAVQDYSQGTVFQGALAGQEIVSITDLADNPAAEIDVDDGEGNLVPRPVWVNPTANGNTPMKAAFARMGSTISRWQRRSAGRHLVLGINVTDGESTDGDPSDELATLAQQVKSQGGELLMTNIHLSSAGSVGDSVVFPDEADAARLDDYGKLLFKMSSPVPAALAERLGTKPGARMMAYNATLEQFARVFEAGSSIAAQ